MKIRSNSPLTRITALRAVLGSAMCVALSLALMPAPAHAASPAAKSGATAASSAAAPLPANAVARVNNVLITQDDLGQAVRAANTPDTPALRTALKNQLIALELFRQASAKAHFDKNPQVIAAVEQAKNQAMMQVYLHDEVKPVPVTDADVKAKYDGIVATLGENEYKPSVIAVKDLETANKVLDALKKGKDFAQLAQQYSQGPAAAQGGALNWISFKTPITEGNTQNWPQPLAQALVQLPPGAVSGTALQVGDTYWVLRMDQKRPTQVPSFDQAKDGLRKQLEQVALETATAQLVMNLVKNAHIEQ